MQNEEILMSSSRENEFGDENLALYFFKPQDYYYDLDIMSACFDKIREIL